MRIFLSALFLLGFLSACNGEESLSWNQRMTVAIDTPDGPVSGSTVYEVRARIFPGGQAITGSVAQYGHRGEAAVIDLGDGRFVFALATAFGEHIYRTAPDVFSEFDSEARVAWLTHYQNLGAPITLREAFYPRFVTFGDIDDPLTADIFEAGEMAEVFGPGYAIASVTLEVVDAPMEVGRIEEVLPWLEGIWPNHLDGNRYRLGEAHPDFSLETTDANQLGVGSFSTEIIE